MSNLTEVEAFNLIEENEEKRAKYKEMVELRKKAKKGTLTRKELKYLCDTAFGKDTGESRKIYEAMIRSGRVTDEEEITK